MPLSSTHRNRLYLVVTLFAVALIAGMLTSEPPMFVLDSLNSLSDSAQTLEPIGPFGFFIFIFFNNLVALFLILISGITFGLFAITATLVNGYLLGFVGQLSIFDSGLASFFVGVVPHGVIELPLLFITVVLSFDITDATIKALKSNSFKPLKEEFKKTFLIFRNYLLLLLLIAAGIEAFVTPHIIRLALG